MPKGQDRAFELDFLRGITLCWVVIMHFTYDMRYIFSLNVFDYLDGQIYWTFWEPLVLSIFVGISGVCCTFSRNNVKRGLKLLIVGIVITVATYFADKFFDLGCFILINVIHVLAISILLYSLISFIEKKFKIDPVKVNIFMTFIGIWIMMVGTQIRRLHHTVSGNWLLPLGIYGKTVPTMGDYMPLIPWVGVFLVGAVVGRLCYKDKKSAFKDAPQAFKAFTSPFQFIGRHSLVIYLVHQPVVLGLSYLIFRLAGKV